MTELSDFLRNSEMSASHGARWAACKLWDHCSSLIIARSKGNGVSPSRHAQLFVAESYGELPLHLVFWGDGAQCGGLGDDGRELGGGGN